MFARCCVLLAVESCVALLYKMELGQKSSALKLLQKDSPMNGEDAEADGRIGEINRFQSK